MFDGFVWFLFVKSIVCLEMDFQSEIAEGEKYYVELQRKSQSYGECWKTSLSHLHSGCKQLTEDVQSRLALSFANCFLEHAGSDPCLCNDDSFISNCLKNCNDRVFNTYTEFFTHTQSICHYLQQRQWQVEIAETALLLTENSRKINEKLDESARSQVKILDLQRTSLAEQKRSITNGKILNAELMRSKENARNLYNEFKTTTYEQKMLLFEMFDRMKNLQNFVLGEFTGVYTAAYYLVVAALIYILTSVPRTANARIWLILIISLNAASEKILTSYTLQGNNMEVNSMITSELLHERIWLCRKLASLICMITLIVSYYRYKDYNVINNELLREIQQQNMELQNFIKGLTFSEKISTTSVNQTLFQDAKTLTNNCRTNLDKPCMSPVALQQTKALKDAENKENSWTPSADMTSSLRSPKITPTRKSASVKKNSQPKSQGTRIPLVEGNILSNLESPSSPSGKRYNLRSSKGLNSPL